MKRNRNKIFAIAKLIAERAQKIVANTPLSERELRIVNLTAEQPGTARDQEQTKARGDGIICIGFIGAQAATLNGKTQKGTWQVDVEIPQRLSALHKITAIEIADELMNEIDGEFLGEPARSRCWCTLPKQPTDSADTHSANFTVEIHILK